MQIREAQPGEAPAVTAVILRSKGHWGYDEAFMTAAAAELTLTEEHLAEADVVVAERPDGTLAGVATVHGTELEHLFVDPSEIGTGLGRRLLETALARAAARGLAELTVVSDPNAEPFYRSQGAVRAGAERSPSTGRELPVLVIPTR